jgi:hypothetical protein
MADLAPTPETTLMRDSRFEQHAERRDLVGFEQQVRRCLQSSRMLRNAV